MYVCNALHQRHSALLAELHVTTTTSSSFIHDEYCSLFYIQLVCERLFRSTVDTLLHNNQLPLTHLVSQIIRLLYLVTRSTADPEDKFTVFDSASTSSQDGNKPISNSTSTTNTEEKDESGQKTPPKVGTDDLDNTDSQVDFDWYDPVVAAYKATHLSEFADSET